jgi:hypothetical protein
MFLWQMPEPSESTLIVTAAPRYQSKVETLHYFLTRDGQRWHIQRDSLIDGTGVISIGVCEHWEGVCNFFRYFTNRAEVIAAD